MKKLRIIRNILFAWFILFIGFGGYYIYYIFTKRDYFKEAYINLYKNKELSANSFLFFETSEDYNLFLQDKFSWSLIGLLILFIMVILFIFIFYNHLKNLYLFYVCNECSSGIVFYENYKFYLEFVDTKEKLHKNHFQKNQKLYKKIYLKRNGQIDIFYNKYNPKNFIIGNKPTFLVDNFLKPFFLDLFIFVLVFVGIYFLHPFLFLTLI